jgi:hypothetical protein
MGEMFNPPHPGLILKDTVLREDGGISVKEFAEKLGMTRTAISRVANGKARLSHLKPGSCERDGLFRTGSHANSKNGRLTVCGPIAK